MMIPKTQMLASCISGNQWLIRNYSRTDWTTVNEISGDILKWVNVQVSELAPLNLSMSVS